MPKASEHIVIVGGTSGIGLSLARSAYALGCKVTIAGRGAEHAAEIAKSIGQGVTGHHVDLEDVPSIRSGLSEETAIDHLVLMPLYSLTTTVKDFKIAEANRVLQTKLTGYIEAVSVALPRFRPTSSIVLFGGLAKTRPYPTSTIISVANAGIVGMMNTMVFELAPIRVNSVSPGLVGDSPKWDAVVKKGENPFINAMVARTPTRQLARMTDVIDAVFFLLDNQSVNGVDLAIDGGVRVV